MNMVIRVSKECREYKASQISPDDIAQVGGR